MLLGGLYNKLMRFRVAVHSLVLGGSNSGPVITASGANVKVPGLVVGTTTFSEAEFGVLDGVTPGTVAASKALIVDANKDLATLRHVTLSGNLVTGATTLSETDLAKIDAVTDGTVAASKAVVVDTNKDIGDFRNLDAVNLDLGASGTAGSLDIFPAAAAKGKTVFTSGEITTDGTCAIVTATQAASRIYTVPDAGGSTTFVMGAGTQTIAGAKTFSTQLLTSANVGTVEAGVTAVEYGDGRNHVTVLTVSTTLPAIAGGANLAVGKLLYTLPAGACIIRGANMSMAITQTQGFITADTPDGGLGSVIASGVVATLDGTATFEDILTGQTFNDCNGTAEVKTVAGQPMVMEAGAAHTVHFNVADGWAANGDAAAILAGTVRLVWEFLG